MAGFALGGCPQDQLRVTAAIYSSTKAVEFLYDSLNLKGMLGKCPWWFGSWLLMPVSFAQLFHAFVFDRETVAKVSCYEILCLSIWGGVCANGFLYSRSS